VHVTVCIRERQIRQSSLTCGCCQLVIERVSDTATRPHTDCNWTHFAQRLIGRRELMQTQAAVFTWRQHVAGVATFPCYTWQTHSDTTTLDSLTANYLLTTQQSQRHITGSHQRCSIQQPGTLSNWHLPSDTCSHPRTTITDVWFHGYGFWLEL